MTLMITTKNMHISTSTQAQIESKVSQLNRILKQDTVVRIHLEYGFENTSGKEIYNGRISIQLDGKHIHCRDQNVSVMQLVTSLNSQLFRRIAQLQNKEKCQQRPGMDKKISSAG